MKTKKFVITGMHCASCSAIIQRALKKHEGISDASVNLTTEEATVSFDEKKMSVNEICNIIKNKGYGASELKNNSSLDKSKEINKLKKTFIGSTILTIPVFILGMFFMKNPIPYQDIILWVLTTPVQFYFARQFYIGSYKSLKGGSANMDVLIAMGTTVAYFYSVYVVLSGNGHQYFEASAVIITLVLLGKYLEVRAKGKTSQAISKLMQLSPKKAIKLEGGKEVEVLIEEIKKDDVLAVKPGTKVPTDGVIITGSSSINESMVTGESLPVSKNKGDKVIGSTINQTGYFTMKVTSVGEETVLSRIIKLIRDAQARQAPIQRLADTISAFFVPIVVVIAAVTFISWFVFGPGLEMALVAAVSVLVIACPCALGLATPTAIMVGTGKGAQKGILIKGGDILERTHKTNYVIFDKTGTITKGEPEVTDIKIFSKDKKLVLAQAYSIQRQSEHSLAKAIVSFCEKKKSETKKVSDFKALSGEGVQARINNKQLFFGNQKLIKKQKITLSEELKNEIELLEEEGKTVMLLFTNKEVLALFAVADTIKKESKQAIKMIKDMGIIPYMITGDNKRTANAIAKQVGITNVFSEVYPEDKLMHVKKLQEKGIVVMVGDGINDAPALAQADIGIAMGSGTEVAMESGDIVLMRGNLLGVAKAIRLSQITISKVKQNLFWAFFYNVLGIPVAAGILYPFFGVMLSPMIAAAAMALSSVSVVSNSLLLRGKKL